MKPEKMTDGEIVELSDTDLDVMSTLRYGREVEAAVNAKWEAMLAQQVSQQPAVGDIRALKHRIHELEGEVIGYKRILDEAQPVAKPESAFNQELAWRLELQAKNQMLLEALKESLRQLEEWEVKIDGEWGDCRSLEELDTAGELSIATRKARAAIEQAERTTP